MQPGTLCRTGEEPELVCGTAGGKVLSLCKAGPILRYRFGKADQVDLQWPEHDEAMADAFHWKASETQGGMGRAVGAQTSTLSFVREGTTYTIDERYVAAPAEVVIHVATADGKKADLKCDQDVHGSLADLGVAFDLIVDQE